VHLNHTSTPPLCTYVHNKINPYFSVNSTKGFYFCFGCGAKGNAIDFLVEYNKLEFPSAVEELASYHSLPIQYETSHRPSNIDEEKQQELFQMLELHFQSERKASPELFSNVMSSLSLISKPDEESGLGFTSNSQKVIDVIKKTTYGMWQNKPV
jgi:DNA primase